MDNQQRAAEWRLRHLPGQGYEHLELPLAAEVDAAEARGRAEALRDAAHDLRNIAPTWVCDLLRGIATSEGARMVADLAPGAQTDGEAGR